MAGDDELRRTVRKLAIDHAETRWLSLRLDNDVKEIRQELRTMHAEQEARFDAIDHTLQGHGEQLVSIDRTLQTHGEQFGSIDRTLQAHGERFDSIDRELQAHRGRFDSTDTVLRSLHQMVGQVLERLPEQPRD